MPPKILIVDDEPDLEVLIRQRFRRQIREGVYDFFFASNGEEALALIRNGSGIDLVLSDINMPVMDGLTLLGHLRAVQPRLGTVIVSAYGDMSNIRSAMNRGAFDFLTKPIDFQDFELTIEKTLRQVHELRAADAAHASLAAVERDLQTAAEIQRSFLPSRPTGIESSSFALHAVMLPARAVAGDFYDFFLLDEHRLVLVIGDVTGKGVPAALFMAVTRTLLRAMAPVSQDPAECLAGVNRQLLRDSSSGLFVSLFYGILDTRTGALTYSVGGHPWPYLVRASGAVEPLEGRGFLVGVLQEAAFETWRTRLAPGDVLFLYTDGVTEARSPAGELWSAGKLEEALRAAGPAPPEQLLGSMLTEVKRFIGDAAPSDDLTALALRYTQRGEL